MGDVCLTYKHIKTRKSHECFGCGRHFPPGSTMQLNTGIFDNHFYTSYQCTTCERLKDHVEDNYKYDGWMADWAREEISESGLNPGYKMPGPKITPEYLLWYFESKKV